MRSWVRFCFVGILLLLVGQSAGFGQAQSKLYIGAGFNASYMAADSLNSIIDRYNDRLGDLPKSLGNVHTPMGLNVQLGAVFGNFLVDLSYTGRGQGVRSRENERPDGSYFVRQLKVRTSTFDIGFGAKVADSENSFFTLGGSLDFGSTRVFSRYAQNDQLTTIPLNAPIVNELNLGTTVFAQGFFNLGLNNPFYLYVRPYFQWAWYQNDFQPVDRFINNTGFQPNPSPILDIPWNFGLKIGVAFLAG